MSWEPIERNAPPGVAAPLVISTALRGRSKVPSLVISLREPPAWMNKIKRVDVLIGRADDDGKLKIAPGDGVTLRSFPKGSSRSIVLSQWKGCSFGDLRKVACQYQDDGKALVIELPPLVPALSLATAPVAHSTARREAARVDAEGGQRGKPGVALPPLARSWEYIQEIALRAGVELTLRNDLPAFNKRRIKEGLAPFAIATGKQTAKPSR
jgi:hypothetical protein